MNLQYEIDNTTSSIITIPPGEYSIGHTNITRPVTIQGPSFSEVKLRGALHCTTRGSVNLSGFRLESDGSESLGINFDYAFRCTVRDCLISNVNVPIYVQAGNAYTIENNYIVGNQFGLFMRNDENADEGDQQIFGNTFDSGSGIAAIHYVSGGGARITNNKILRHSYGILGQFEGNTSDLLINNNSIENQTVVCIALRVQSGSFSNVTIVGNQFAANANGITADGVTRGIVTGNVYNLAGHPFFQCTNNTWLETANRG